MSVVPTSFCSKCGKKREAEHKFCLSCGEKFQLTMQEEKLVEKWGTDASPTVRGNFIGMFTKPSKTLERIYDTKNSWEPGFIIVVFFALLIGASSFIILFKTNFTVIGSDIGMVTYFQDNILSLKIYLAIFDVVANIIQWIIYILLFYVLLYFLKKKVGFEKLVVLGEYSAIFLLFLGIIHVILALLLPTIQSTIDVDVFVYDFEQKLNAIISSNLLLLVLFYSDYPITLIFFIVLGYGLKFKEDLEKYQIILIITITFVVGQVLFPIILLFF